MTNQKSLDKKKTGFRKMTADDLRRGIDLSKSISGFKVIETKSNKKKTKELDKRVKLFIEAWYIRTLECIDMDNGDRVIPPPTKKEWELGVKKDLDKLLTQQRSELLEEIKTRVDTWGGFEDDGGNLCHYDSEILEWLEEIKKL